jgi:Glycosyltransferases involved in cell wall biogenesis
MKVSVVIPAKNEAEGLKTFLPELVGVPGVHEIIVVDDGSADSTVAVCEEFGATVYSHPYSMGNGAAIKTGARKATGDVIVFMDGDGQHSPKDIPRLLAEYEKGFSMVVGARGKGSQASAGRWLANSFYNKFAGWMTGRNVEDLTSGFRVANAKKFREFLPLLPNGFSYPTTSTMAFFRSGYGVSYVPINVKDRVGTSHIRIVKDGVRFLLIIFKVGTLYSPLKVFFRLAWWCF